MFFVFNPFTTTSEGLSLPVPASIVVADTYVNIDGHGMTVLLEAIVGRAVYATAIGKLACLLPYRC